VTKRDRIVLIVIGAAALIAAFWMLALAPKREQAAELKDQVTKEEQRRDDALARVRAGEEARRTFADDYATIARLGKAVPVGDQTPSLVYQLENEAKKHKIDLRLIKVRTAGGAAAASAPAQAGNGSSSSSGGGTPTPGAVPQATQAAAAVAPPGSAVGPAGFPTLPFEFAFEGDFFKMERLFSALERFTTTEASGEDVDVRGRLVTLDAFAMYQSHMWGFPRVTAQVLATAYVLPPGEGTGGPAETSGTTAAAPGQTASSTPSKPTTATATAGGMTP
jgi:hypothetical protein